MGKSYKKTSRCHDTAKTTRFEKETQADRKMDGNGPSSQTVRISQVPSKANRTMASTSLKIVEVHGRWMYCMLLRIANGQT